MVRDTNLTIKNYISNIAIEATTHILQNNLSDEKKSSLVENSIQELSIILKK